MAFLRPLAAALAAALALASVAARAQGGQNPLEEVDPDTAPGRPRSMEEVDPPAAVTSTEPEAAPAGRPRTLPGVDPLLLPVQPTRMSSKPLPVAAPAAPPPPPEVDPTRAPAAPIRLPRSGDGEILEAWARWRKAAVDRNVKAQDEALGSLLSLKEELGVDDLEPISVGLIREADARLRADDPQGAVALAARSVQLSPHLPAAHFALSEARFRADATDIAGWGAELLAAAGHLWASPRFSRPAVADLGAGLLFALVACAVAVVPVLFARKARYLHHDFHHLFPRAVAPWQSAALAALLLLLPVIFRAGLAPLLLVLFAAACLYLSTAERAVAAILVASLGLVPLGAGKLAAATAFAGTPAEDVLALDRGGLEAQPAAGRVAARVAEGRAQFAELHALGRYRLRRGDLDGALDLFKRAARERGSDARLLTNLGNVMLARGDPDGAADMYRSAIQADATLAAPLFNLSRVHERRARVLRPELALEEKERARGARDRAGQLDPGLLGRSEPPENAPALNLYLLSPALPAPEMDPLAWGAAPADEVAEQLSAALTGRQGALAWLYPFSVATVLFALGFATRSGGVSGACDRCGRPVCRRCDPELSPKGQLCTQCVNVFVRRNAVAAPVKVRKQLEVDRYQARMGRFSYLLGLVCSGAGHVFHGRPVHGAVYSFLFLFAGFSAFYRQGVLRSPYGSSPLLLRLMPLGLLFLVVYLFSLRGLRRRLDGT